MGVAADCEYVTKYGTQDDARQAILTNWNTASALYKVCLFANLRCGLKCESNLGHIQRQSGYRRASSPTTHVNLSSYRLYCGTYLRV